MPNESVTSTAALAAMSGTPVITGSSAGVACSHCGLDCGDAAILRADRNFCCQGCLLVFELLHENGLEQFYQLGKAAGFQPARPTEDTEFAYLDEPLVRGPLVQFSDDKVTRVNFRVPAIHCIACVWLLENLQRLHAGVRQSQVNFPRKEVSILFANGELKLSELVGLLASLGYAPELKLADLDRRENSPVARRLWLQTGVAGFAFGNVMLFSLPVYFGLDSFTGPTFSRLFGWFSLVLALPVLVFSAQDYWRAAWSSLRQRRLALEVPIALGLVMISLQSTLEVVRGLGPGYFDSLTGLLFFLLIGRVFQQKTYDRLSFDRDYKSFFPLAVTRLVPVAQVSKPAVSQVSEPAPRSFFMSSRPDASPAGLETSDTADLEVCATISPAQPSAGRDSSEERVSLSQLGVGDRLLIRNGELIPADARLIEGPALIDYSFVTGESDPVTKAVGDTLFAGGRQMGGLIEVEMMKPVNQSYLTSLWNQDAFRKERAESFDTLINRYSQRFTLTVVGIAVAAGVGWSIAGQATTGMLAFTSVLIVACPCALALATPFTVGTALRVLGRRQVFLKGPQVVELLANVDTVVFDKTGTLTAAGKGAVRFSGKPLSAEEAGWLFSLARHSTHPYAVRIHQALEQDRFPAPVRSFLETAGKGIEGQVAGHEIWMGSAKWVKGRVTRLEESARLESDSVEASDLASEVHVAIDGCYRGCFQLNGELREDIGPMLGLLNSTHELVLLSGDNEREQSRFKRLFGTRAELRFNQTPLDKLEFVHSLQRRGRRVLMVGDGLNDSGALRQADVGLAVVEEMSAFSPSSDGIMAARQVPELNWLLGYSRDSMRVVKAGLAISAAYNVVGVGVAAAGLLSPIFCAIFMPLSSITVVAFATGMTTWLGRGRSRA